MSDALGELARLIDEELKSAPIPEILPPLPPPPVVRLGTAAFESPDTLYCGRPEKGVFVIACAEEEGHVYGVNDDRHVAIVASPRAGKSAGSLTLNAISHRGSLVALDIKGELASTTARVRAAGSIYTRGCWQRTILLDPFKEAGRADDPLDDLRGAINPLDFIDPDHPEATNDVLQLADALCPEETSGRSDPFFSLSGRSLTALIIMHVLTCPNIPDDERTLITVHSLMASGHRDEAEFWRALADEDPPTSYALLFDAMQANPGFDGLVSGIAQRFGAVHREAARQFYGVLEVANQKLEFFQSAGMRQVFSYSSFDLADLKRDPNGISIYLCLPPRYLATHFGFFRTMLTIILRELQRDIRPPASGAPVLMLLDEFAALKRMPVIESAIAQIAGYGVRIVFAVQTLAQLKEIYKEN